MNTTNIEQRRSDWLGLLKKMVEAIYAREGHYNTLCPQSRIEETERAKAREAIVLLTRQIHGLIHQMDEIARDGGFGVTALMGHTPDDLTATVILLMLASRLNSNLASSMRGLDDLIHFAADSSPDEAFFVRSLFRSDSCLYPFVSIGRGIALDDCSVILRESSYNRMMGLSSDLTESRFEAEAILSRSRQ